MKLTKRLLAMLLLVCMVFSMLPAIALTASAATVTGSFVKCTSLSDVTTGDYIIVGAKTTSSFGRLTYGTLSSSRLAYTQEWTSAPAGPLSNPDGASVWHLEVSGTNVTIYNAENSKYLNSGFSLATSNPTTYTIAYTSNYFTLKNGSNYIGVNKSTNYWRTYASSTLTNNGNLLLFKKSTSKTLSSIAVSSNHRTFTVGDTFVKETVTATYSDSTTADVTNSATFSGYNMSSAGTQTVTASYTEGGVTKTATYTITVTAPTPYTLTYSVNGDTSVISGGSITSGTSVTLPTNVTAPTGYTFSGWVASAIGTETMTAPTVLSGSYTMPAANTTLYAVYTRTEEVQGGGSSDKYELVTSASSLAAGDKLLIVGVESGTYYALKPYVSGNNCGRNAVSAPVSNVITTTVADLTLGGSAGAWTLFDGTYYLYAAGGTTNNNYLKGAANANNANAKWTISFSGNNATIKTTDSIVVRHTIMHNTNNDVFSCYASGQSAVSIYKQQAGSSTVTYYTTSPVVAAKYDIIVDDTLSHGMIWFGDYEDSGEFEAGTTLTLDNEADSGYQFDGYVLTNADTDEDVTATYISGNTLTMPAFDVILSGSFSLIPANVYTVTTSSNAGGSISSNKDSAEAGDSVTITINPTTHYHLTSLTVDGSQVTVSGNSYTFTMPGHNVAVAATFAEDAKYTVTLTQTTGGTLNASQTTGIYAGQTITLSANANTHYTFNNDWQCTAGGASISGNTFTMPAANVTVTGSFTEDAKYTVTFYASSLAADTASALSVQSVYGGESATAPTPGSKDGFSFIGWYTTSGTWSTNPGALTPSAVNAAAVTADVTYYGVWAEGDNVGGTFKLVVDGKYVGGRTGSNKYLNSVSSEADAAEFGIEDGGYLYMMDGSTKTYVSNKSNATDISFSTSKSDATPWTVTETASGISFTTTATGERELAYNVSSPRFAAYQGNATNYPYIFTKIGGGAASEYTTDPVQVASHTVFWHNGDTYVTTSAKEGTAITAPEEAPTKDDYQETYYTFAGWSATEGGAVVSSYGNMGTSDMHFYAVFTPATYSFTAAISGADSVKVDRSKVLTASLTADPTKDTGDYTVSWTTSDDSKVSVDANGRITGLAEGSAVITATYTLLDGTTVTATKTITVLPAAAAGSGYTLITQDNVPEDWTGDYIIMGKIGGDTTYMNTWMLLTPNYDGGSAVIASNNEDAATITIEDDGSGIGTGTINDEGNASSGVDKSIVMEDTGLVTDTNGDDSILVYDTITEIDDGYAFTIECIDDVNQIYTIRVKDTNLYIACVKTGVTTNSLNFDSSATEYAQWRFSVQRVTKGGYNNDIIVAQNIGNSERCLYFNSNSYGATNGQFCDYRNSSTGSMIGGNATGGGQTYNLYLFGNPNPFKAQIYYHGEQITLVETGEVHANAQTAQLTGALTPDIDNYPNWTQVGNPAWEIVENSTGNNMTINSTTGLITTNASSVGSYALVKVTYTVHDEVNNVDKLVSTTSKVEVINADTTYSTVIYELYSGEDTEVQYTVPNSMTELPLAAYVVNDTTDNNSKTGNVVMGGTLNWSITSTSPSTSGTFSIDANGVLHMSNVTRDSIVTVRVTGATGDNISAADATYKVYITVPTYTVNIVPTSGSAGTHDTTTDTLTVPGTATGAHLTYEVKDGNDNGPSSSTFSTAGYAWTISGDAQGALINSNGVLDFSGMDRTVDHTITVVVSRIAAIDAATGVISSGLTDTITVVVEQLVEEDVMEAVNDVVIIDWALPVTFDVLKNDNYNVEVSVAAGSLPAGVASNGNGSFTYRPSGWQTADQTFTYTLSGIVDGVPATATATVTLKTADSIYYEDTYSGIFTFTGNWSDVTDGTAIAEQTSSLDTADIFEYDAHYEAYAMYSGGTAKKTTVSKGANASVSFTFAGTGFDVISATNNNAGAFMLTVKDSNNAVVNDPATGLKLSKIMDNFRGYTYTAEGYTRYGLVKVTRYAQNGDNTYVPSETGGFYYDSETQTFIANNTWYNGEPGKYYDDVNQFADMINPEGSYILKEFTSNWLPYEKGSAPADTYNTSYYQIPIIKVTGLEYGTYTVTLKPTYSAAFDRAGDGSYDFYFDGVRIHNPVANRAAEYKYISIHDAVKNGEGFGSGEVVACDHVGYEWSDWTFYSRARNTTSTTTTNRGSFVQYCSYCHGVAKTAYFHVNVTADDTDLGVGGYNSLPSTTMLRYTLTADACGDAAVQTAVQAKLNALTGSLTEYWSSNTGAVMTCMNNSNVVIARGEGTTYATLQLKDPATQTIYASAIHSPVITVSADADHVHTFGNWTHDAASDPSTHTHTCTGENCSFYETESCVFTEEVTTQPTQSTPGSKTCTCALCSYSYVAEIPALGGHTATFHVPAGATAPAAQTGSSVTMPAAVAAPAAFDAHNYTFVGWVGSTVSDTTTEQTVYTAGTSVTLDADTDFYALYSYEGEGSGNTYKKVTSELSDWSGNYMIVSNGDTSYALNPTFYSGTSGEFNTTEVTVSNNTITNSDPDLVWTFTPTGTDGQYSIHNSNGYLKITGTDSTNAALSSTADDSFTIGFTDSTDNAKLVSVSKNRVFSFYSTCNTFRTYASSNVTGHLYKQAGALTYTTILAATCKHTNATTATVNPTCTGAGSTTVTCDDCHEVISETPIAALGHYYVPTPATGGTTYTCSRCGDSYFEADEFEVSYVLQPGVTVSGNSRSGNAITLPNAVTIPAAYNAQTYTFVGWANATSVDGTTNPTVYAKGEVVNIIADTTFYPVYSYGGGNRYTLVSSLTSGNDYIFVSSNTAGTAYALDAAKMVGAPTHTTTPTAVTVSSGATPYVDLETDSTLPFHITTDGSMGSYTKYKMTATVNDEERYLTINGNGICYQSGYKAGWDNSNGLFGTNSKNTTCYYAYYADGNFDASSSASGRVYAYEKSASGGGTTTYTFELKAASDSYAATLTPATLNMTTGSTASLTATLTNNGAVVTAEDVEFSSSNTSIVLVDEDTGYLVAGETAGTATITVEMLAADGELYTATCAVTVKEQSDNVTVNYIGSVSGNVKNWGTRGTTATFLTTPADEYYTGSYSYETLSALSGDSGTDTDFYSSALGTAIHSMLTAKQTSTTSYAGTTSLYAYTDCIESGNKISSFYSAALVGPNWDSGSTWNREHTWPNSKGLDGADENDIMMLRPTAVSENSSRGNTAYGEGSGYYDPNKLGQSLHGDVARLMLQHLMRWGNTSKFYGTGGVMESRAILLKWLAEDPVDTWELGRNDAVQRITGVRNVFVDYPELAFKLLGADVPANYTTPSKSGIVAAATYSASAGSGYEPVTEGANTPHNSPRATAPASARTSIATGSFNGAVIIDGKGAANTFDDFAAYGPNNEVYLAPGQGIVFSLTSDVTTITSQDLQIGAKAVNGTATQMDVASISNGTVSTGIKYLLENKTIASATEMYYKLNTTQMGWNNGESSVIVIYNSGSGVLSLTNLRYSTANNNTLTMNINDVETQSNGSNDGPKSISRMRMAMEMLRIVYGEPITKPDTIEPTDPDLNFNSAALVLNSDIAINFYVDEAVMNSADNVYAAFTKALYNEAGEITGYAEETVSEATFDEKTGMYSFRFTGINPAEMGSEVTATLYGYRNGEPISGKTLNYSVLTYVNNMFDNVENTAFRTMLANLVAYGEAAQKYVSYNTANPATDAVSADLMAFAAKEAPTLTNCTAISGEGAVSFTAAYLSLREKVTVCYTMDASKYEGNAADLELRIFDGANEIAAISGADFTEENGKYVASFSGLNALQMRTVLTAEVYAGDTCVSSTLNYSIESYAQGKAAGNDALAELVNAMMSYGDAAAAYFAD